MPEVDRARFAGKTILVTGASTGIGKAVAIQLARGGAQVIVTARREVEGELAAADAGHGAVFMRCDLADPASIDKLFAEIEARFGGLDGAALGIRVNCLCPGTTRTEMMEMQMQTRPGGEAKTVAGIPLGRASDPAEQAAAAIWLLGAESSFVTGQCLVVDGGRTIV